MYLEYAKLETAYIAKLDARRRILGLDSGEARSTQDTLANTEADIIGVGGAGDEDVSLENANADSLHATAMQNLSSSHVLQGAIPIAIFDAAMKTVSHPTKCFANASTTCLRTFRGFHSYIRSFSTLPIISYLLLQRRPLL